MAKNPNRWDRSNWTAGPVTLVQALGLKWKVNWPKLTPQLGVQSAASASQGGGGGMTGTPNPNVQTPMGKSEDEWVTALLKSLNAPVTAANKKSLAQWIVRETPWPPVASFNPMNTTYNMPGATNFNSVGVKNYANEQQGMQATVLTLQGGYPRIVAALKSGNGLCGQGLGAEFAKWSGGGYTQVC